MAAVEQAARIDAVDWIGAPGHFWESHGRGMLVNPSESSELRILILEDVASDAELMERELRDSGMTFSSKRVKTKGAFLKELENFAPTLILADYTLPGFDGMSALSLALERHPDVPFIFVSGTIGEERAVEALKTGATDYVLKDRLPRLGPTVRRALQEVAEKAALKKAEVELAEYREHLEELVEQRTAELDRANKELERDIAERKRAEEALRHERDSLMTILEAMQDGVFIVNQQYDVEYINPALEQELGPLEHQKCYAYFHERDELCPWCRNDEVFAGKTVRYEWTSRKTKKTYDLVGTPIRNPDGSWSKLEIFRDITERKDLEQLKDEFIGLVSHELRSPLTVVSGGLNTVLGEWPRLSEQEKRQLLQDAAMEADSLSHILGNLLELSRAQAGKLSLFEELVDVKKAIRDTVGKIKLVSPKHAVVVHLPRRLGPARADRLRVERILYNLLDNAAKYSPDGGKIEVFAAQGEDYITVSVKDYGIGIPDTDQERLFQPFQRLAKDKSYRLKGTGLGLLVCRRLVEAHGGHIWVESKPGRGSAFHFTLPLATQV